MPAAAKSTKARSPDDAGGPEMRLVDASVRFGDVRALDGVSLEIAGGRTTAVIGPSGCGKSTLLRVLVGLVHLDSGSARVGELELSSDTGRTELLTHRRGCGFVLQEGGLFPHLTARGNATLLAKQLGWPADRRRARLDELVALTRLPPDALDRYPAELSGGQRQRVALLRALFLDPGVLLLDEPLGALDPIVRYELQEELREIVRSVRKTVVLVTHDLAEAAYLGDEVVLMRGGRVVQTGPPRELVSDPADDFVASFVRAQRSHLADLDADPESPAGLQDGGVA